MNSSMFAFEITKMDEEFLAALKLITGEEILAIVCPVNDEAGEYVIVENPIEVEEVQLGKKSGARVGPWMKFSNETTFIIPKEKIVTLVEVSSEVEVFYKLSLRKLNRDPNQLNVDKTNGIGRIGSVEEARQKLENLFKN
jgi:hypothetical protein